MIDPYLSNSVERINPANYRRVPVDESFFHVNPDLLILTHNHLDRYDPKTVERILSRGQITVLAPKSVWKEVRRFGGKHNYVQFDRLTEWSECGVRLTAVKAVHSDDDAIGVMLDDGEKKYYVSGDTLYNSSIFADLPNDLYAVFLPINGIGNNMNMLDAARFAKK